MALTLNKEQRADYEREAWRLRRKGYSHDRIRLELAKPETTGGLGLDVAKSTVTRMLQRIELKLSKEFTTQAAEMKARQVAQLEYVHEEATDAWERSQKVAEQEKTKAMGAKPGDKKSDEKPAKKAELDEDYDPEAVEGGCYLDAHGEEIPREESSRRIVQNALERFANGDATEEETLIVIERTVTKKWPVGDPRFLKIIIETLADQRKIYGLDAPVKQELTGENGGAVQFAFVDALNRVYGDEKAGASDMPTASAAPYMGDLDDAESDDTDPGPYPV